MRYQFDEPANRQNVNSIKWDRVFKKKEEKDLLPMWVADMDFQLPEEIENALLERAKTGFYGYEHKPEGYIRAFLNWAAERHNWEIPEQWLLHCPGVVTGLALAVEAFTEPGDKLLIQTPVYPPFRSVIKNNSRVIVESPLVLDNGRYEMDFGDLEKQFASGVAAMMLCSPHNPVGRVWTRSELEKLVELAARYDVLILADEIWGDLVLPGHKQLPIGCISPEAARLSVTFTAPSKTFNLAGFYLSNVIIPNSELKERYEQRLEGLGIHHLNSFGAAAAQAAYESGQEWLDELLKYLEANVTLAIEGLAEIAPRIKVVPPEGTYLIWLDCRELGIEPEKINEFFLKEAGVILNDGPFFGKEGLGFQRMNIACPRSVVQEALSRIDKALAGLSHMHN